MRKKETLIELFLLGFNQLGARGGKEGQRRGSAVTATTGR